MSINFLDELNDNQREAVLYNDGPSLVIAGAGSGKTRVLTYKIAYLLQSGVAPWHILALTFTNKAAREMKERIASLVGDEHANRLWMGTFHSIFSRILRKEAASIGFTSRFTIYDQSDSRSLLKAIIKEMELDEKVYKPSLISAHISAAKNRLLFPDDYATDLEITRADGKANVPSTGKIYARYMARCKQADAMDFDDLLLFTYRLFEDNPDICAHYAERFRFVLVDEYQDTNYAQHRIVWQLTENSLQICAVGDDAQSIYSFRGANIENILRFTTRYDGAKLFKLEQNYRSTQTIVNAANSVIHKNRTQIQKKVFSENNKGDLLSIFDAYSDTEEAEIVCNKIAELNRRKDIEYNEVAILYRTNAQSRVFEESLRKRSIPYRIYGGLSFYQRKEIKDAIAYFRLAVNPCDEEAFKRIINYPARGIGDTTLRKIVMAASMSQVSLWDVICRPIDYGLNVSGGILNRLAQFRTMMESFMSDVETTDAYMLGQRIIRESGLFNEMLVDNSAENMSRRENIEELVNAIRTFVDSRREEDGTESVLLTDYLSQISLLSDMDSAETDEKQVTLMTVHSAKGLEFDAVFIVGMEEDLFPNMNASYSLREKEEERRLFYVAITRARQYCFLSYSKSRFRYGKMEFGRPSSFLDEIDPCCVDRDGDKKVHSRVLGHKSITSQFSDESSQERGLFSSHENVKRSVPQPSRLKAITETSVSSTGSSSVTVGIGNTILHERFGKGVVKMMEGTGDNAKATVLFENVGEKKLLLKYARFEVVG